MHALELVPQLDLDNLRAEAIELHRVHEARADLYLWLELEQLLQLMMAVCDGLCRTGETMTQALTAADTGFDRVLSAFSGVHGRGASHWLRTHAPEGAFASHLQALLHQQRAENGGFLSKLFGRKK